MTGECMEKVASAFISGHVTLFQPIRLQH